MNRVAYLFLNGDYAKKEPLAEHARGNDLVIGVDGGNRFLLSIDIIPHIMIGDMDSLSKAQLLRLKTKNVILLRYPAEKDETDFELALNYAISHEYKSILVFGALGGRPDHMLSNILLPIPYLDKASIRLIRGIEEIFFITKKAIIKGKTGDMVSLIPMAGTVSKVNTTGLRYSLDGEDLHFGKTRGMSNEMLTDSAEVTISSGILLCIHTPTTNPFKQARHHDE